MSVKLLKEAYTELIEDDLAYLNLHCKDDDFALQHIEMILRDSIHWYYPEHKQQNNERD